MVVTGLKSLADLLSCSGLTRELACNFHVRFADLLPQCRRNGLSSLVGSSFTNLFEIG